MRNKLFDSDHDLKEFIQKVSSISGIKKASIQQVWEYTIYTMLIDVLEKDESKSYVKLPLPYIGNIMIRDSKEHPSEFDTFICLYDSFKEQLNKVKDNNLMDLIKYFQEHFISPIVAEIESSPSKKEEK